MAPRGISQRLLKERKVKLRPVGPRKVSCRKVAKAFDGGGVAERVYTDDEVEWLKAIDSFRSRHHRAPTPREQLDLAARLGYRKVAAPETPRPPQE